MELRNILNLAAAYEAFQIGFGFSGARRTAIADYLPLKPGQRVIDIGCGPGKILTYLPEGIDYIGFDIDQKYIDHANATYAGRGRFYCRPFDAACADEFGPADAVMFNGVLHHLDDALADTLLGHAFTALKPGGSIFTLDGCYRDGQNPLARKLLDMDRGQFVRHQEQYEALLGKHFKDRKSNIREDMSRLPYTFIVMTGRKPA